MGDPGGFGFTYPSQGYTLPRYPADAYINGTTTQIYWNNPSIATGLINFVKNNPSLFASLFLEDDAETVTALNEIHKIYTDPANGVVPGNATIYVTIAGNPLRTTQSTGSIYGTSDKISLLDIERLNVAAQIFTRITNRVYGQSPGTSRIRTASKDYIYDAISADPTTKIVAAIPTTLTAIPTPIPTPVVTICSDCSSNTSFVCPSGNYLYYGNCYDNDCPYV